MKKAATREEWLERLTDALRPKFKAAGYPIPAKVHVSCAWPSSRATSHKSRAIGECWPASSSADGHTEIFISPTLGDPIEVGGTLVHELLHAAIEPMHPDKHVGHGPAFKKAMGPLGLNGKATATGETKELKEELAAIVKTIGAYPHAAMKLKLRSKIQSTRLLKASCPECGYIIRVTAKWIEEAGLPTCPCGGVFEAEA